MASKQICYFYRLQPANGFWTWKRDRVNVFPGCVKNSTTALENKGNCITGRLARADLHTGVDLSWITQKCKRERKKMAKKKACNCSPPLCMLMNRWHLLINALLCLAAYQGLGLKTEGSFRLKVVYNIYWEGKDLYLYKLWIFVRKKPFCCSCN